MKSSFTFDSNFTARLAKLSALTLTPKETEKITSQFQETIKYIDRLNELNTSSFQATPQVTGLYNRFRQDVVDSSRILSQKDVTALAAHSYQGFILVPAIFKKTKSI